MVSAAPLATRVSMRNMEVVDEVCRNAAGCGGSDVRTLVLVLVTAMLALLVFAAVIHVREAKSIVDEERERLAAERDAFASFARRVADVEAHEVQAAVPASGGITTTAAAIPDDRLDRIKQAYRETVMAVSHYEADYGEPLAENVAAEFGDGVALALVDGGRLTPQLKSALLSGSQEAQRSRRAFLTTLEEESASLAEADEVLRSIDEERESIAAAPPTERSYGTLVEDWRHLGALAERCRDLVSTRQGAIRDRSAPTPPDGPDLQEYLYDDLPVTHPVLADAAALVESIESLRSRVLHSLTRRV